MKLLKKLTFLYFMLSVLILLTNGYNLSPIPNYVFDEPAVPKFDPERSSYFGYSLNLRINSLFVGAPRANSTIPTQRKIDETGAIYKCDIKTESCAPYIFDEYGNTDSYNDYYYDSSLKDYQWLGAVMDGSSNNDDKLMVCAPRRRTNYVTDKDQQYFMHGICYLTSNTDNSRPTDITELTTQIRNRDKQEVYNGNKTYYYYMHAEQGFSVHISDDQNEILLGAPGVSMWRGSIIRRKLRTPGNTDNGHLSRRDLSEADEYQRIRKIRQTTPFYDINIPNPDFHNQPNDSYLGYAVSSGYFRGGDSKELLYVASAPQAFEQTGEVYIFEIVKRGFEDSMNILKTFQSDQLGDYFGYALLTEDFDNDGYPDLAIAAPMHSKASDYDNGVVYIYRNNRFLEFTLQATLSSEHTRVSRFGTALGRLGDLNQDGYNDLAVGAPFEGNGVVYIYYGNAEGILSKPVQRLVPEDTGYTYPGKMFGHSISKGVDIDQNGYNDLAIGSPEEHKAYIYRSYPIVKIVGSVRPAKKEIPLERTSMTIDVCWYLESKMPLKTDIDINLVIKLDPQGDRVKQDNENVIEMNVTGGSEEKCTTLNVMIEYKASLIFKPIIIELHHDIVDKISTATEFCETCVKTSPLDPKFSVGQIVFTSGCTNLTCYSNLKLSSEWIDLDDPPVLIRTKSVTIEYTISNNGDTAFLPQLNITLPMHTSPIKVHSNCDYTSNNLLCSYNHPLRKGNEIKIKLKLDTSLLQSLSLTIHAEVFAVSSEIDNSDNIDTQTITFQKISEIEIISKSLTKTQFAIKESPPIRNISYVYEIYSKGPTYVQDITIEISIPTIFKYPSSSLQYDLIQSNEIFAFGTFQGKQLLPILSQNDEVIFQTQLPSTVVPFTNDHTLFETHGFTTDESVQPVEEYVNHRRRRRNLIEEYEMRERILINSANEARTAETIDLNKIKTNYPASRTIFFNCDNDNDFDCVQVSFSLNDVGRSEKPIYLLISFPIDLSNVEKILNEEKDIFVVSAALRIYKTSNQDGSTLKLLETVPYTEIQTTFETPIWVYVVSIIGGLLILILITYIFYRLGFFNRAKKDEMTRLTQENTNNDSEDE